jgi:hypothetical protein
MNQTMNHRVCRVNHRVCRVFNFSGHRAKPLTGRIRRAPKGWLPGPPPVPHVTRRAHDQQNCEHPVSVLAALATVGVGARGAVAWCNLSRVERVLSLQG